jgi:hypothetical protein
MRKRLEKQLMLPTRTYEREVVGNPNTCIAIVLDSHEPMGQSGSCLITVALPYLWD